MIRLITILLLFLISSLDAQNFQGKAIYKTHRNTDLKISGEQNAHNADLQKKLQEQMKKMFQKTYTLNFTKSNSTYTQNKQLEPQVKSGGVRVMFLGSGGGNDILYKNIAEKRYINKTEISGKQFLIKDKLKKYEWTMSSELKMIGKYTCYKATRTREEEITSFKMVDGENEENKEKVTIKTTVWYTPEIPINNGPDMYWGLPGLILEVHEGEQTIVCTELMMKSSNEIEIKEPKKGKKVTQEKFNKIMKEKTKEMIERFKNNRKSKKNGESINIESQE